MKLTEKQKRFADYYIESGNATEAYKKAYKCKDNTANVEGTKSLVKPSIREYIDKRLAEKDKKRIASQDEVLEFLTKVFRGEVEEEFALGVGKGAQTIIRKELDGKDRIKAAELLGKRYGLWVDKQEITGEMGVTIIKDVNRVKEAMNNGNND